MKARREGTRKTRLLIVGLGNPLAGDDGFGSEVIEHLTEQPLPYGVVALEGGDDPFVLLPHLQNAEEIIIVDVIHTGNKPGTVYKIPLNRLVHGKAAFSQHEISLLTLYQLPFTSWHLNLPDGNLLAVEIGEIDVFSEELSPPLQALVPVVAERIWKEIRQRLNVELYPL